MERTKNILNPSMNMKLAASIVLSLLVVFTTSCDNDLQKRKEKIQAMEKDGISTESLERKNRSIQRLKGEGVPTIDHLPVIEDSSQVRPRTKEEVCNRAIALCVVSVKGEGLDQETINSLVEGLEIQDHLTPNERSFIEDESPTEHDKIQFVWRYECYWVMLWALGYIDEPGKPESICDVPHAVTFLHGKSRAEFIDKAELRSIEEILDQADLIYRYHWAVVDARVNNGESPAGLDSGVVMERHHALNWLIRYMDQEWDNVSTDT